MKLAPAEGRQPIRFKPQNLLVSSAISANFVVLRIALAIDLAFPNRDYFSERPPPFYEHHKPFDSLERVSRGRRSIQANLPSDQHSLVASNVLQKPFFQAFRKSLCVYLQTLRDVADQPHYLRQLLAMCLPPRFFRSLHSSSLHGQLRGAEIIPNSNAIVIVLTLVSTPLTAC